MLNKQVSLPTALFLVCVGLLLVATVIIPCTLTLHWNNIRALFNIQYGNTEVTGQQPGCEFVNIPHSGIKKSVAEDWAAQSGNSVEVYMLAKTHFWLKRDIPSADLWRDHPLIEWGAISVADDAYQAANDHHSPTTTKCARALGVIRAAQDEYPENGALWLAEGLVHFANTDDEKAVSSLKLAAEKPNWKSRAYRAFGFLNSLLQLEGLTEFDAAMESEVVTRSQRELHHITRNIVRLMTDAVQDSDDGRFASLLHLLLQLQLCRWTDMNYAFPVIAPPTIEKDLFEAMASRMELEIPGDLSISYSERRRLERRIAHDFVLSHVSEKAAFELMDMYRTRQIELNSYHSWSLWNLDRFEYTWFLIRAFGTLAITLLALSISFLATELPYAISGRGKFMDTKSSRGISFWIAALIAAVVSSLLIYRACDSTLHVVGLRAIPEEPELSNVAFGTIYLTSIVIVVLVLRHFVPHRDRRAFLVLQVAPLLMYLATVCVTELLRDALVNRTVSYYATLHGDSAESPGSPS